MVHIHNVNPNKLHDELIKANLKPSRLENDLRENETVADNVWITFPAGTNLEVVQAIIDSHDSTPPPAEPTEIDYLVDLDYRLSLIELGL